jgi:exosortase E/protease (VPEID-CTERM system)
MVYLRPALLIGLLLLEYMTISYLFDAKTMFRESPLPRALSFVGSLAPLAVVALTATLLLSGQELSRAFKAVRPRSLRSLLPYLAANAVFFAVFLSLTRALVQVPARTASVAWLVGWSLTGAVAFGVAALAVIPPGAFRALGTRATAVLGAATAVGAAAWLAGLGTNALWAPFARVTLKASEAVLARIYPDAFCHPETLVLGAGGFFVTVSAPCSGFEGLGLCVVLMSAYLWFFRARLRFPAALLLLPIAVAAVWAGNIVRIVALVAVGVSYSPEVALGAFHAKAGWLVFSALCLGVAAVGGRSRFFARKAAGEAEVSREERAAEDPAEANPTAAYVAPLIAFAGTALITTAFAAGPLDRLYLLRVLAAAGVLFFYWRRSAQRSALTLASFSWTGPVAGVAVLAFWLPLTAGGGKEAAEATAAFEQTLAAMPTWAMVAWVGARLLGAVLVVPIVEELAFRGFLARRLVAPEFEQVDPRGVGPLPILISSFLFGLVHGAWLAGTLAGVAYALVQRHTGRLRDAMVAHATTNLLLAIYVLGRREWVLWL